LQSVGGLSIFVQGTESFLRNFFNQFIKVIHKFRESRFSLFCLCAFGFLILGLYSLNFAPLCLCRFVPFLFFYIFFAEHADENEEDGDDEGAEHEADESPFLEADEDAEEHGDRMDVPDGAD
jgi:hypothetical protein